MVSTFRKSIASVSRHFRTTPGGFVAQRKDENKRLAIRNAVVSDVIEVGLSGTSMTRIAAAANLSPGTIYLYYPNKDALLQQVFIEIKSAMHEKLMQAFEPGDSSAEKIRNLWFAMFAYLVEKPRDFAFHETINAAQILTPQQQSKMAGMAQDIRTILNDAVDDGTLKPAPVESILAVLMAPALHLARRSALADQPVRQEVAEHCFDMIWSGISNHSQS